MLKKILTLFTNVHRVSDCTIMEDEETHKFFTNSLAKLLVIKTEATCPSADTAR